MPGTRDGGEDGEDTSIRISQETWRRLRDRKDTPGKTHDEIIRELLDAVESQEKNGG